MNKRISLNKFMDAFTSVKKYKMLLLPLSLSPALSAPDPWPPWCPLAPQGCCYLSAWDSLFSAWPSVPECLRVDRIISLLSQGPFPSSLYKNDKCSPIYLPTPVLPAQPCLFCSSTHTSLTSIMLIIFSIRI